MLACTAAVGVVMAGSVVAAAPALAASTPTVTAQAAPSLASTGQTLLDVVTISSTNTPTGTITFSLFGPGDTTCASSIFTATVTVTGNGSYVPQSPYTTTSGGTYRWVARYNGDTNNNPVSFPCNSANQSVSVAQYMAFMQSNPTGAAAAGQPMYDMVDLFSSNSSDELTGSITFSIYGPGDPSCTSTPLDTSTTAVSGFGSYYSASMPQFGDGTFQWVAAYSGDAIDTPFTTQCQTASTVVHRVSGNLAGTAFLTGGQTFDTAQLQGYTSPTGTITFSVFGPADPTCAGVPASTSTVQVTNGNAVYSSASYTPPGPGTYNWQVSYSGDGVNEPHQEGCGPSSQSVTVLGAASTIVTTASAGVPAGGTISDSAVLTATAPTGTITFRLYGPDDTACAQSPAFTSTRTVTGNGTYTSADFTTSAPGKYLWVASYSGDAANQSATEPCGTTGEGVTVTRLPATLSASASPGVAIGGSIAASATMAGGVNPTGTITFAVYGPANAGCQDSAAFTSTATVTGNGTYTSGSFTPTSGGIYQWVASYGGDVGNAAASSLCGDAPVTVTGGSGGGSHSTAPADFDGDGHSDISLFRPSNGHWYLKNSGNGTTITAGFGLSGDIPVTGDYDGDGKADLAVFRPSNSHWYVQGSASGTVANLGFGVAGDIPVPGAYDGDGRTDLAVFRPSTGHWYIRSSTTGAITSFGFGVAGDIPVPGDYDGDGKTDLAVFRPSNGRWYIRDSSTGTTTSFGFGLAGDIPVPGDYDGDGKTDLAVFRPSTGHWYIRSSLTGTTSNIGFGRTGDIPVPGDYDGDGITDLAVFRPSNGTWYVDDSSGGSRTVGFGLSGDIPADASPAVYSAFF
jgi:hypothetical protein